MMDSDQRSIVYFVLCNILYQSNQPGGGVFDDKKIGLMTVAVGQMTMTARPGRRVPQHRRTELNHG